MDSISFLVLLFLGSRKGCSHSLYSSNLLRSFTSLILLLTFIRAGKVRKDEMTKKPNAFLKI
jgi:hypothetical protein